jgi:hypothetical protein
VNGRSAQRNRNSVLNRNNNLGFRPALSSAGAVDAALDRTGRFPVPPFLWSRWAKRSCRRAVLVAHANAPRGVFPTPRVMKPTPRFLTIETASRQKIPKR